MNQALSVGHSVRSGFIWQVSQAVTWTVVELRSCALRLLARAASPHLDPRSPVASLVPHTVTRHVKLSVADVGCEGDVTSRATSLRHMYLYDRTFTRIYARRVA